jgi:hypothetical protein
VQIFIYRSGYNYQSAQCYEDLNPALCMRECMYYDSLWFMNRWCLYSNIVLFCYRNCSDYEVTVIANSRILRRAAHFLTMVTQ